MVINLEKYLLILHYIQGVRYILNAKRDVSPSLRLSEDSEGDFDKFPF